MATPTNLYEYYASQGQALPSVQARKAVASQAGIANYSGTAQQNQQLLSYLTGNRQTSTPSTPVTPTINATNIGSTTPMNIPAPTPAPNYNSLVASFAQDTQQAQEQQSQAQQGVQDSTNALLTLSRQLEGQTLEQQQLEQQQGIPQLNQDLLDLQNQARQRNLQYQQQFVTAEGKPVPMDVIVGEQAQLQRQNAIDIALINSNIQAKQGQLGLAQATVQSALNAKYEPIKAQIETQKLILDSNYKLLSSAEKKLADAKQTELNLRLKQLDEQKQNETVIQDTLLKAIQFNAPQTVINAIKNAPDANSAIVAARGYLTDPLDTLIKKAQLANINSEISARNNEPVDSVKIVRINGIDYVQNKDGSFSLPNLPTTLGEDINKTMVQNKIAQIQAVIGAKGESSAVGTNFLSRQGLGRTAVRILTLGTTGLGVGNRANFTATVEQITKGLTLQTLIDAKAGGATFGALSEGELRLLADSASKIDSWAVRDKNGKVLYYKANEADFNNELMNIKNMLQSAYNSKYGTTDTDSYLNIVENSLKDNTGIYSQAGYNVNQ